MKTKKKTKKTTKPIKPSLNSALLEVGCEEIPARFVPGFLADLRSKTEAALKNSRLSFSKISTIGTGRRLVLSIEGLPEKQPDIVEERKGPSKEIAFDQTGKPTQAALGFAKSMGLTDKELNIKSVGNKEYVFAVAKVSGQPTEKVLSEAFPKILTSLYLPLAMRWGDQEFKFIRPIHWMLALFGKKIVQFELAGIKSSNSTRGHRYKTAGKPLKVTSGADILSFKALLAKNSVIVDNDERKDRVRTEVSAAAKSLGARAIIDNDLLYEVTYLVEYGNIAIGSFDPGFLELPKEILITSMKKNQKYFPVESKDGTLKNSFIVMTDCPDEKTARETVVGNNRVISARLSDAKFFFDEDRKVPLHLHVDDLKRAAFHAKLGTIYEKVQRIGDLSVFIAKELKLEDIEKEKIKRSAMLCKADLVTKMVFEFGELQGVMGREYALASGEDAQVAKGIFEHYLPRFTGDSVPETIQGTVVGIADKLDSIVGFFSAGLIPTGSEDPYGLRRQGFGVVDVILKKRLSLPLEETIERSYKLYEPVFLEHLFKKGETGYKDFSGIRRTVLEFLSLRLRGILQAEGVRYDVCDAVLSTFSDAVFSYDVAKELMKIQKGELLKGIVTTSDRIARISKGASREQVIEGDLIEDEERSLYQEYLKVNWDVGTAIDKGDIPQAIGELARMTRPVDQFFEKILVMHNDERIKTNRLALLKSIDIMYKTVADFPRIVQ